MTGLPSFVRALPCPQCAEGGTHQRALLAGAARDTDGKASGRYECSNGHTFVRRQFEP